MLSRTDLLKIAEEYGIVNVEHDVAAFRLDRLLGLLESFERQKFELSQQFVTSCAEEKEDQSVTGTEVTTIPAGVYYSKEHDNFYKVEGGMGMGLPFRNKWIDHVSLFPQSIEDVCKPRDPWPELRPLHLEALMFAYNEGYSKAVDGRVFPNPFTVTGSQAAAWELGTRDGKEQRKKLPEIPPYERARRWVDSWIGAHQLRLEDSAYQALIQRLYQALIQRLSE